MRCLTFSNEVLTFDRVNFITDCKRIVVKTERVFKIDTLIQYLIVFLTLMVFFFTNS